MALPKDAASPVVSRLTSHTGETAETGSRQIGYGRAWRDEALLLRQYSQLRAAGCVEVYGDDTKGSSTFHPALADAISRLSAGDCLVVACLSHLAWREDELRAVVAAIEARGGHLRSLAGDFDTRASSTVFQTLRALHTFAEAVRRARDMEAIAGDPRSIPLAPDALAKAIAEVDSGTVTADQAASALGISRATFYRRRSRVTA